VAGDPNDGAAWQRSAATTFASLDNFRDVGGAATVDGRHVRTGRLFRSDTLTKLSANEEFGRIADAVDRRYINISPQHRLWDGTPYDEIAGPSRFLADRYHDLTHEGATDIGEVIATLAEATTGPTLVHCFAGKDRTGVVIALTLAIVGVGVDAIADDYALSNDWAERFVDTNTELARHWILAPREAMTVFLAELVDAYGSVEGYLATAGVGPKEFDALRDNLLV